MTTQPNLRLKSLSESHRETNQLINRLSKPPSRSGTNSPLNSDGDTRVELSAEIHQSLKEQEEDYELLKQEAEDLTSSGSWGSGTRRRDSEKDRDRITLVSQVERLGEDLKLARAQFRKAQLQAKRNAESAKRKERELLFASVQEGTSTTGSGRRKGQEKISQDDLVLNASNDVTAALRRLQNITQQGVERSQFAIETLQTSSAALTSLNESYNTLDTLLSSSRSLVSTLIHSQKSDTWYLETTFYILLATIAWLVFRRILYGPGWWLLYLPTKLMFRFVSVILQISITAFAGSVGAIGGSSGQDSALSNHVSEIISSASTSLIVKPSASGGFPKIQKDMPAPSIAAGSGGEGAKAPPRDEQDGPKGGSVLEKIGEMIDETRQDNEHASGESEKENLGNEETVLRERTEDEAPNRKKRMFEEQDGQRVRDEL